MFLFTVIKIAVISLLIIYVSHMLWNYYTTNQKKDIPVKNKGEMINSALQNSKKMYEDMAKAIQSNQTIEITPSHSIEENPILDITTTPSAIIDLNKDKMQEELKEFMENIT